MLVCRRKSLGVRVAGEQRGRHQVDANVGTLGREDGGDQQLQRVFVVQRALGVGILFGQEPDDLPGAVADGLLGLHEEEW